MMHVTPRWRVELKLMNSDNVPSLLVLFIDDNFVANVMQQLATISFEQPVIAVTIELQRG